MLLPFRPTITHILTKLEAWVKTDIRYLIKGGGALMVGQVGVSLIGLASATAFANLLPKEAYGTYQYILTSAEFLAVFSLIGISRALVTSTARGFDGTLDYAFKKALLWSAGAFVLGFGAGAYYLYKGDVLLGVGIGAGTAFTLLITASKIYLSFLNGKQLFALTSSFIVSGLLIPAVAIIATLFWTSDVLTLVAVYFISNTAVNLALFAWARKYRENDHVDHGIIKQSMHLSAQALIGRLSASIDRILLFQFAGPVVLAEFWIAQNIQRNFSHLFKSANGIVLPKLSVRSFEKLQESLPLKILFLYAFIIPFTVAYMLAVPYVIAFFFPLYESIVFLTQVFGLLFLFLPTQVLADALVGHGMNKELYRITTISSCAKLLATVAFVPFFGIWGVVLSTFADQTIYMTLVVWYFLKRRAEAR